MRADCFATLSEQELGACAQSIAASVPADSRLVRLGAVAFWSVVLCLLAARVLFFDAASLHPSASLAQHPPVAIDQVAGNAAATMVYGQL